MKKEEMKQYFTDRANDKYGILYTDLYLDESVTGKKYEPQEFEVENNQNADIHVIICLQILLQFYEKIPILVN